MQMSQLYRRGVVRPLDDKAARQLASYSIEDSIRAEWLPIPCDSQFDAIWESGVFQRINEVCHVEISDYEEIELPSAQVDMALMVIRHEMNKECAKIPFFRNLEQLLQAAKDSERSVYFVL